MPRLLLVLGEAAGELEILALGHVYLLGSGDIQGGNGLRAGSVGVVDRAPTRALGGAHKVGAFRGVDAY